jgi:hypothetical protein
MRLIHPSNFVEFEVLCNGAMDLSSITYALTCWVVGNAGNLDFHHFDLSFSLLVEVVAVVDSVAVEYHLCLHVGQTYCLRSLHAWTLEGWHSRQPPCLGFEPVVAAYPYLWTGALGLHFLTCCLKMEGAARELVHSHHQNL